MIIRKLFDLYEYERIWDIGVGQCICAGKGRMVWREVFDKRIENGLVDIGWIHKQPEFTAICQLCGRVEPLDHSGGAENG
jgi:hypothetical protein